MGIWPKYSHNTQRRMLAPCYDTAMFLRDILKIMFNIRFWILALLLAITAKAAISPSVAWIAKNVLETVDIINKETIIVVILAWGPIYLLVLVTQTTFGAAERIIDKLIDVQLLIRLQRVYLDRRKTEATGRDSAQVLFGARIANKGFDIIYKKVWDIISTIVFVLLWQLTLGSEWIMIMVLSVILPLIFVWKLGPYLQHYSREILDQHETIASNTAQIARGPFEAAQIAWMYSSLRFHIIKWLIDEGFPLLLWGSLGLLTAVSILLELELIPQEIEIAAAAAALINLKLLAGPLKDIGKVYANWREAYPAMLSIFLGGDPPQKETKF